MKHSPGQSKEKPGLEVKEGCDGDGGIHVQKSVSGIRLTQAELKLSWTYNLFLFFERF